MFNVQKREGEAARDELRQERNSMRRTQQNHMQHMEVAAADMRTLQGLLTAVHVDLWSIVFSALVAGMQVSVCYLNKASLQTAQADSYIINNVCC